MNPPNNITGTINNVKYIKLIDNQPPTVVFYNTAQTIAQSIDPTADFIAYNCAPLNNPVFNVKTVRPFLIEECHVLTGGIPYIKIYLNNFHSCYDLVLEFQDDVTQLECDLIVNKVHHVLPLTQSAPNKYRINDFTLENQLIGTQTPFARYILVKYDKIPTNSPVVSITGTACNYKNFSAFAPTNDAISFTPSK